MSRPQRFALLGVAVVALVVGLVLATSGSGGNGAPTAGPATIVVQHAKPVGGVRTLTYRKGATIDLTVRSDTADEVHFHGYDRHQDVERGGAVRFRFPATIDGQFVVELEEHKQELATVRVEP